MKGVETEEARHTQLVELHACHIQTQRVPEKERVSEWKSGRGGQS